MNALTSHNSSRTLSKRNVALTTVAVLVALFACVLFGLHQRSLHLMEAHHFPDISSSTEVIVYPPDGNPDRARNLSEPDTAAFRHLFEQLTVLDRPVDASTLPPVDGPHPIDFLSATPDGERISIALRKGGVGKNYLLLNDENGKHGSAAWLIDGRTMSQLDELYRQTVPTMP